MDRVQQLQQWMGDADVDAVVLRLPENLVLTTGYYAQLTGLAVAVVAREGMMVIAAPDYEAEEAAAALAAAGVRDADVRTFPIVRVDVPPPATAIGRIPEDVAPRNGARRGRIGFEGSLEAVAPAGLRGRALRRRASHAGAEP